MRDSSGNVMPTPSFLTIPAGVAVRFVSVGTSDLCQGNAAPAQFVLLSSTTQSAFGDYHIVLFSSNFISYLSFIIIYYFHIFAPLFKYAKYACVFIQSTFDYLHKLVQ